MCNIIKSMVESEEGIQMIKVEKNVNAWDIRYLGTRTARKCIARCSPHKLVYIPRRSDEIKEN